MSLVACKDRALRVNYELQASDKAGDNPSASELAERLELSERQILEAREAWLALEVDSLDRPVRGQHEWKPQPVSETIGSVDDDYELADQRFTLGAACRKLPVRERLVLHMRFIEDRTQTEIAATIGLSQMQVSRILRGAIERLELAARPELEY
jgi:RNA polymerase sigma-B factor